MKLFGTDGIRGRANTFPITPKIIMRVGQAVGYLLVEQLKKSPVVLIGKDTRLSGYMVEQALASGLNSMGTEVILTGPLPTPGISFLARNMRVDAGFVISASHNIYSDNGIKIFGADGFKISSQMEKDIETLVFSENLDELLCDSKDISRVKRIDDAAGRYIVYAKNALPLDLNLEGLRIVLDCAHGAGYKVAPAIFKELGADVIVLGDKPNGCNINEKSGALYPHYMAESVKSYRADIGIAIDGDGDRLIICDEKANMVNGDRILALCAAHLKSENRLEKDTVVATHMSNLGLDQSLKKLGIKVCRTNVGDKNVIKEMVDNKYILGGEQSGHIIFLEHSTTGDGCVAALNVLAVMRRERKKLSELGHFIEAPQILISTRVKVRENLEDIPGYNKLLEDIEFKLKGKGRTYVRFSGTEPVIRILVEGPDKKMISGYAESIAEFLQDRLG